MRKDITLEKIKIGGEKVNKSALARQYNCCWETIDRRCNPDKYKTEKKKRVYTSMLDEFKGIIDSKVEIGDIPATGIYYLLKDKYGYKGKYGIVRKYVSEKKKNIVKELTIRFETIPGYQSQVDWKEKMKLHSIDGTEYVVSIFLIVLGNSRFKYIELTSDQTQETLFRCMKNAFAYFGGTTEEILFDNMKTIVDQVKSTYSECVINSKALQFSKDAGFRIVTCRPYNPETKGKVETLAKIMNRLKVYDREFKDFEDLANIVKRINYSLNYEEISQATDEIPINDFKNEKEYLIPVNIELLETYIKSEKEYKVSKDSTIKYNGVKYSVPIEYIGKQITVSEKNNVIQLYYSTKMIREYNKRENFKYQYYEEDYIDILKNSCFDKATDAEIAHFMAKNQASRDKIYIERKK